MGIKFLCPGGHKLHVKSYLAGHRGVCPQCGQRFLVPSESLPNIRVEPLVLTPEEMAGSARPQPLDMEPGDASAVAPGPQMASAVAPRPLAPPTEAVGDSRSESRWSGDPLSEAPQAVWYLRLATGDQYGPAKADLMRRWLNEGRVPAEGYVWREGWTDWRRASVTFPQLLQQQGPADAQPVAKPVEQHTASHDPGHRASATKSAETQPAAEPVDALEEPSPLGLPISIPRPAARSNAGVNSRQSQALIMVALALGVLILLPILYLVLVQR